MSSNPNKKPRKRHKILLKDINKHDLYTYIPDWKERGLNLNQCQFIINYIKNGMHSAAEAYRKAYKIPKKNSYILSSQLLSKPEIAKAIKDYLDFDKRTLKISYKKKLRDILYIRATYDIKDLQDENGQLLPYNKIPQNLRYVIDGLETRYHGENNIQYVITKLADRNKALEKICKHVDPLDEEVVEESIPIEEEDANLGNLTEEDKKKMVDIMKKMKGE